MYILDQETILTYVYKPVTGSFDLSKNQLDKIPKELVERFRSFHKEQIAKYIPDFMPEGTDSICVSFLMAICHVFKQHWNQKYPVPRFTIQGASAADVPAEYKKTYICYLIDWNDRDIRQFTQYDDLIGHCSSFVLLDYHQSRSTGHDCLTSFGSHEAAFAHNRRNMLCFNMYKKKTTSAVSSDLTKPLLDLEKRTGLILERVAVASVNYLDLAEYKRQFVLLQEKYPDRIIYAYPYAHEGEEIRLLLCACIIPL